MRNLKVYSPFLFVLIGMALFMHYFWLPDYKALEEADQFRKEEAQLRLLADTLTPALLSADLAEIENTLSALRDEYPAWKAIMMRNSEGARLYPLFEEPPPPDAQDTVIAVKMHVPGDEDAVGSLTVHADIMALLEPKLKRIQRLEAFVLASTVVVIVLGALLQHTVISTPLKRLSEAVARIADGDYGANLPRSSDSVLNSFITSFDHMRRTLQTREQQLRRQRQIQDAVRTVQTNYLTTNDKSAVFDEMLRTMLTLTGSQYGLIGESIEDEHGNPSLKILSISNLSWDVASRRLFESALAGELTFSGEGNLLIRPLITGQVLVSNDPGQAPESGGLPPGHPRLDSYIGIPLFNAKQQLTGLVGLANAEGGYTKAMVDELNLVWSAIANLIHAYREKVALAESEASLRALVQNAVDGIITIDSNGTVLTFNPAAEDIFGYLADEVVGRNVSMLMTEKDADNHDAHLAHYIGGGRSHIIGVEREVIGRRKNGEEFHMELSVAEVRTGTIRHFTGMVRDVSVRKEQEMALIAAQVELAYANDQLKGLSRQDSLTGLANRRHFDEALEQEYRRATRQQEPISLIMFDIDHFKLYNDHYGHVDGDTCLRAVAQSAASVFKRAGDLAARYGGEEFAIILPNTPPEFAARLAETTLQEIIALALPHDASPTAKHVTASFGVAGIVPTKDDQPTGLIEMADQALYQAKANGRMRVHLYTAGSSDAAGERSGHD